MIEQNRTQVYEVIERIEMGFLRSCVEVLSLFDWITPSVGLVEDLINDPTLLQTNSWTFFVPYDKSLACGWNAMDIKNLMKDHGIHYWGSQITGGEYFFSVKLDQARWAEYLLLVKGIPLTDLSQGPLPPPKTQIQDSPKLTKPREIPMRASTSEEIAEEKANKTTAKKKSGTPVKWMGIDW